MSQASQLPHCKPPQVMLLLDTDSLPCWLIPPGLLQGPSAGRAAGGWYRSGDAGGCMTASPQRLPVFGAQDSEQHSYHSMFQEGLGSC